MSLSNAPTQVQEVLGFYLRQPGEPRRGLGAKGPVFPGYRFDYNPRVFGLPACFLGKMVAPPADPEALLALCGERWRQ